MRVSRAGRVTLRTLALGYLAVLLAFPIVTILWRMEGQPEAAGVRDFTDVEEGRYYTEAVAWADKNGIAMGQMSGLNPLCISPVIAKRRPPGAAPGHSARPVARHG